MKDVCPFPSCFPCRPCGGHVMILTVVLSLLILVSDITLVPGDMTSGEMTFGRLNRLPTFVPVIVLTVVVVLDVIVMVVIVVLVAFMVVHFFFHIVVVAVAFLW